MTRTDTLIGLDMSGVEHCPSGRTGELTFMNLPAALQRQEDDRLAADEDVRAERGVEFFYRAATAAERYLLGHLGYRLPARLETKVKWRSDVRRREWPQLRRDEQ